MGRNTTGIVTVNQARKLRLQYLLRAGAIKKGQELSVVVEYPDGAQMLLRTVYKPEEAFIELSYTVDRPGDSRPYKYRIRLQEVPSNLGKGSLLYFVCPATGRRTRTLYQAYHSHTFQSREAYRNRIYYPSQLSSHISRFNDAYWRIESTLEELYTQRRSYTYRGQPTRRLKRIERLQDLQDYYNTLRWSPAGMPLKLRGLFYTDPDFRDSLR